MRKQTEELRKGLDKLEAPYNQMSAQIMQAEAEVATKKTEIEDINRRKEKIAAEKEQNQTQVDQLREKINALAGELKGHTEYLERSKQEQGVLKEREAELRRQFDGLGQQLRESQMKLSQMQQSRGEQVSKSRVLTELKNAQKAGKLGGIVGRLGDLGAIDAQFDVAITTAAGAYLEWIVVDTVAAGERAIAFLRQHEIGRASFLVLETIDQTWDKKRKQPFEAPQNSQRLFDLVKPGSERYLNAFYFALKNVLVCQTIDDAQHAAYNLQQRHRVVTLAGELFDPSGNISGGGQPRRGGMSSKMVVEFSEAQIQAAAEEVREKERQLGAHRNELQEVESKLHALSSSMLQGQRQADTVKVEMQNFGSIAQKEEQKIARTLQ